MLEVVVGLEELERIGSVGRRGWHWRYWKGLKVWESVVGVGSIGGCGRGWRC